MTNNISTLADDNTQVEKFKNIYFQRYLDSYGVSWSNGSDEDIVKMVDMANEGKIDLADYWNLGDERQVDLSAMSASSLGESHSAQTVTFVLMHQGLYDLVTPVLDKNGNTRTKCSFVVGMKHCLTTKGAMGSQNINLWDICQRRTWCNSIFRNAIPSTLRSIFAQFKTVTTQTYNGSTIQISEDYFTLPAEKEIYGTVTKSSQIEADNLTQFWYYASGPGASNKQKTLNETSELSTSYFLRSTYTGNGTGFVIVNQAGNANYSGAQNPQGLSLFGCI